MGTGAKTDPREEDRSYKYMVYRVLITDCQLGMILAYTPHPCCFLDLGKPLPLADGAQEV